MTISHLLGRSYGLQDVEESLEFQITVGWEIVDESKVLQLLDEQNIVSVFGGSESGRRIFGNRSILADQEVLK